MNTMSQKHDIRL